MVIVGDPETRRITIDGRTLSPVPSQRVWNHSPTGFSWGYGGSGPAQLALALLLRAGVEKQTAVRLHQDFKREVIAQLPMSVPFALDINIEAWARERAQC